jgi:gliding motility-associated-like protein
MNINDENIGKLFQQTLKDVEVQPDEAVWTAVSKQAGISSGLSALAKVALYFIGAAILVSSYFLWQQSNQDDSIAETEIINNATPVETPKSENIDLPETNSQLVEAENVANTQKIETTNNKEPKPKTLIVPIAKCNSGEENHETIRTVESKSNTDFIKVKPENQKPEEEIYQPVLVSFESIEDDTMDENIVEDANLTTINSDTTKLVFSDNPTICFGEDAILEASGGESYEWSNGSTMSKIKVSPVEQSTTYWVIVHDRNDKQTKHDFTVTVDKECTSVFVPSAFTPNGDGINDVFKAEGMGIQSFEMVIYSREGKILFESNSIDMAWDGTYHGESLSPVAYIYQIVYTDAKGYIHSKKGHITLIR